MEKSKESQIQIQVQKPEEKIKINGKLLPKNFMVSMPVSSNDYDIICDILNPDFLTEELKEHGGKDYVSGICYGLNTHDTVIKQFLKKKTQTRLLDGKSTAFMMEYFNKIKLRLIEPESEKLRLSPKKNLPFLHLKKIPKYFEDYIRKRKEADNQDAMHFTFWKELFNEDKSKKKIIAHFISWHYEKEISERKADIFIPSVPYIKLNLLPKIKNNLLFYTQEINRISYGLYGEESAFYFVIDADLFTDKESIQQINDMIINAPHKYLFFKILNINKMLGGQFGYYAKKNFEGFLTTLLNIRELSQGKIIGMLNGGGFSYCLLNVVLNFFTDTVNNFSTEGIARYTGRHRSLLHPISLTPERINGVLQQLDSYKSLFLDDSIASKYRNLDGKDFLEKVRLREWSIDARKMGLLLWQRLISARLSTDRNKLFDEIVNSNFSFLGGILRNIIH